MSWQILARSSTPVFFLKKDRSGECELRANARSCEREGRKARIGSTRALSSSTVVCQIHIIGSSILMLWSPTDSSSKGSQGIGLSNHEPLTRLDGGKDHVPRPTLSGGRRHSVDGSAPPLFRTRKLFSGFSGRARLRKGSLGVGDPVIGRLVLSSKTKMISVIVVVVIA